MTGASEHCTETGTEQQIRADYHRTTGAGAKCWRRTSVRPRNQAYFRAPGLFFEGAPHCTVIVL